MNIPMTLAKQIEAINRHDPSAFAALYSEDATVADPMYGEPLRGRGAIEKDMADFITAFPDLRFSVERTIVDDAAFASEIVIEGTHRGPLLGPAGHIPATNRRVTITGGVHARIDGSGRVVDEKRFYDVAAILSQLGIMQ